MVTTEGTIILRLSDSTPLHRDNFLRLVKSRYLRQSSVSSRDTIFYDTGRRSRKVRMLFPGNHWEIPVAPYTIPAEFRVSLFHKRGVLAAARESDDVNPQKASSGSQFYIVQGKNIYGQPAGFRGNQKIKKKNP